MVSSTTGHRKPMFEKHWCTKWVPRVYQMGTTGVPNGYIPRVYQMGTTGVPNGYHGGTTWVRQMASASFVRQFRSNRVQSLIV